MPAAEHAYERGEIRGVWVQFACSRSYSHAGEH